MRLVLFICLLAVGSPVAAAAQLSTVLHVDSMMCGADPHLVRDSLLALKGVADVKVSLEAKTAVVSYDNAVVTLDTLLRTVGAAGYPAQATP
jgi:mercuric ion binding protein